MGVGEKTARRYRMYIFRSVCKSWNMYDGKIVGGGKALAGRVEIEAAQRAADLSNQERVP